MKLLKSIIYTLLVCCLLAGNLFSQDWANLNRFKEENANVALPSPDNIRVVFMGNSITEGWKNMRPEFFEGKAYYNRGISGQTTPQMLIRFRPDVIKLFPEVVVILAGTNDIAGNTGPSTLEMIADNIKSMAELARAHGIKVIISSVLPAYDYPWKPGLNPANKIPKLNEMLKAYAARHRMVYLDYFSAMADDQNGLLEKYTYDGVHPNKEGYKAMEPLVENAIAEAINKY